VPNIVGDWYRTGADVSDFAGMDLFSYRCGCVEGYRRHPLVNQTWCDSIDMSFDLIYLADDEGAFKVTLVNKRRVTSQLNPETLVTLSKTQKVTRHSEDKTISRFVADQRRQRIFYLTNERPNIIHVSAPAPSGSESLTGGEHRQRLVLFCG
jgi:hypothetical protein